MDRLFDSGAKLTHFFIESIGREMIKSYIKFDCENNDY